MADDEEVVDVGDVEEVPEADEEAPDVGRLPSLQAYMRSINRYPLLTADEEHKLAVEFVETRNPSTGHRLVNANLRLVVKIAYEYSRAPSNMLDLIQEGNYGMLQAVNKFDPYRGVKLSSYGAWWIRAYILRFILNNWRLVKLGTTQAQRKLFFNLNKERQRLAALGYEATPDRIAQRLKVNVKDVEEMNLRLAAGETSLDMPVNEHDGTTVSRVDLMVAPGQPADAVLDNEHFRERATWVIGQFRKTLDGKDSLIFDHRLVADEPLTLQELGDEFGISRERVRQLEAKIMHRLKTFVFECEKGQSYGA